MGALYWRNILIKGLFISSDGELQQIGDLTTLASIIQTMETILPQLKEKELEISLSSLSEEVLQNELNKRHSTQRLEP
jgi:hypothetical protein